MAMPPPLPVAAFNFTIDSGEPLFIDVIIDFTTYSHAHDFAFDYIVDTARGWEGDTHEIVKIDFTRELDTNIIEYRFYPDESVSFSGDNYTANVTWDFHISGFDQPRVTFIVQQQEHPTYHRSLPPEPFIAIIAAVILTAVVFILAGLRRIGRI